MLASLRRSYAQLLTSGAQLLLLIVGFHIGTRTAWLVCLGLMAFISLVAWYSTLKRLRLVAGMPTSTVASAAQGYVELQGRGRPHGDAPLISKLRGLPCLWYRYKVEEKSGDKWQTIENGEVAEPFLLDDDTGKCIVDPEGAEIITMHTDIWHDGSYRYTEWKLLLSDKIYALGEFRTHGGSTSDRTLKEEINQVLHEWKADMPALRARFDLNSDGKFDEQEWLLARKAAKREAELRLKALRAEPDTNFLIRPQDGRLFLISNYDEETLTRRYHLWAWLHVIILIGSLAGFGALIARPI